MCNDIAKPRISNGSPLAELCKPSTIYVLDGYDATRKIKALPGLVAIPIIAVSSSAIRGTKRRHVPRAATTM